jgi:hypothetical protein
MRDPLSFDADDGTPLHLMNWTDMDGGQKSIFVLDILTLCAPLLGVLLAVVSEFLNWLGWL